MLLFDLDFNFCEFVWFHVVGAGKVIIIGTWQSLRLVMKGKMLLICQWKPIRFVMVFDNAFDFDLHSLFDWWA